MNLMWAALIAAGICLLTALIVISIPRAENITITPSGERKIAQVGFVTFLMVPVFGIAAAFLGAMGL